VSAQFQHHAIGDGTYYWLGPKSTITPLHQDATSLFHVHMKVASGYPHTTLCNNTYQAHSKLCIIIAPTTAAFSSMTG
jgi:hypothetical protein